MVNRRADSPMPRDHPVRRRALRRSAACNTLPSRRTGRFENTLAHPDDLLAAGRDRANIGFGDAHTDLEASAFEQPDDRVPGGDDAALVDIAARDSTREWGPKERLPEIDKLIGEWPENVVMGVSVENEDYLDRIDRLRGCGAVKKFLSLEPLLGPLPDLDLTGIDWVIVGGESGPGSRPMKAEWARDIRDQCVEQGVAFLFKQWGAFGADGVKRPKKRNGRDLDGRTWDDMPAVAFVR